MQHRSPTAAAKIDFRPVTRVHRAILSAAVVIVAALATSAPSAHAALSHSTVESEFSVSGCSSIQDIDLDESAGYVYVTCGNNILIGGASIHRFNYAGEPVDFTESASYISGNTITASPGNIGGSGSLGNHIAVDNSGGPRQGYIYDGGTFKEVDVFLPSGKWNFSVPPEFPTGEEFRDLDVQSDGSLITMHSTASGDNRPDFCEHITEYDQTFHPKRRLYQLTGGNISRVAPSGVVWQRLLPTQSTVILRRFEPDQWSTNLSLTGGPFNGDAQGCLKEKASPTPLFPDPFLSAGTSSLHGFDLDINTGDLYVDRANRVEVFSGGSASEPPHNNAPTIGEGELSGSTAVAVTQDDHVFADTGGSDIIHYGPGDVLPDIATPKPAIGDIGHTQVTVAANVDPVGGSNVESCVVDYAPSNVPFGEPGSETTSCAPDPESSPPGSHFSTPTDVEATLGGLTMGSDYHYRFRAENGEGSNVGLARVVTPAYVLKVQTLAANEIDEHGATLRGSFEPDSETTYHFEYGSNTSYGQVTPSAAQGVEASEVLVGTGVEGLPAGKTFHYRLVATNEDGTTFGEDQTFRTASTPDLGNVYATEVGATKATLNATVNPVGYDTTYRFEYGQTPEYGQSIPIPEAEIGSGATPVEVSETVEGLAAGRTYHYRVVATNKWGSSSSADTTVDFEPPLCPNGHVRQQTRASYLPDCRAYELVSPPDAGGVLIVPGDYPWMKELSNLDPYGQGDGDSWPLNTGKATAPSRLAFYGGFGSFPGIDAPNNPRGTDMYLSTRTSRGWTTALPGLKGSEVLEAARKECSEDMSLCVDHDEGAVLYGGVEKDFAPYVFRADGTKYGQVPTNVDLVPGGHQFSGPEKWSADFSHFFFSSRNVPFTAEGVTGGLGSAYDNDVGNLTVNLISKLANGDPIPQNGSSTHAIEFPAVSADGSHVLMETQASGSGPFRLYLRDTSEGTTYDVANGASAEFVGMTRDGRAVLFTSSAQLTLDDTDTSVDLYRWDQDTDSLTRLSQGGGNGDSDACGASWTSACSVQPLDPERLHPHEMRSVAGLDDLIAEGTGDVYFFSPESLDGSSPGIPNRKNLYIYRHGAAHLVAIFDEGTKVDRMQISPDGAHAAFLTSSRLTSYDNRERRQMYVYEPDTGALRCASCNPRGFAPLADVAASQGGPFMADDGRTFFATKDSLVERDANAGRIDVYEYVGGKPQLITTGQGVRDNTGGEAASIFTLSLDIGLESVSADGRDVYFSTYETLSSADRNGPYLKFYDARSGGGFADTSDIASCVAADECHGADSAPPAPAVLGTTASLGGRGNAQPPKQTKKKKSRKRKNARRKKHRRARKSRRGQRRKKIRRHKRRHRAHARGRKHGHG